MSRQLL